MNHHHDHQNNTKHDNHSCHNLGSEPNSHYNHDKHAGHSVAMFKDKFWISVLLTLPVLLYTPMIQMWFGFTAPEFTGSTYVPLVFSTIIFFYGGMVFIKSAVIELKNRAPGMMTLVSLAILVSYFYSVVAQLFMNKEGFFWELATLITIMLLGHWLEMASVARAQDSLDSIAKLLPDEAEKIVRGRTQIVKVASLTIGDNILVKPGTNIPVDGRVIEGQSSVDESAISGESKPVLKTKDQTVIAGTTNQDGSLTVEVTALGGDTALAGIMQLVAEAQNSKSQVQVLADKAAFYLTIIAIFASTLTFFYWLIAQDVTFALERAVTVLIIACPHALGLAIPLVVSISSALAVKNGLLIRKRIAFETARKIDWVVFDKTGTLTKGEHEVTSIVQGRGYTEEDILQLIASLEHNSEHIIGRALVNEAKKRQVKLHKVTNFLALPGVGVQGVLQKKSYKVVSGRYLLDENIALPSDVKKGVDRYLLQGQTAVYLLNKNKLVLGAITLADAIREQSRQAINLLHQRGIKIAMITGDSQVVADHVAKDLKVDEYIAEVKPKEKAKNIQNLQSSGTKVAFVGDGMNDAPALATADIGIAIGAGTDVAIQSADIILVNSNPLDVAKAIELSQQTHKKMVQNLVWATGYNVLALPLASGVFYGLGVTLSPAVGAVLMSLSTIVVAFNAQLLRKTKLEKF